MGRFCPDNFNASEKNQKWAIELFCITYEELERQVELMKDYEFRRSYTDWQRVFRNWMRKADEIGTLRRPYKHKNPEIISEEQKKKDAETAIKVMDGFMEKLKVVK